MTSEPHKRLLTGSLIHLTAILPIRAPDRHDDHVNIPDQDQADDLLDDSLVRTVSERSLATLLEGA